LSFVRSAGAVEAGFETSKALREELAGATKPRGGGADGHANDFGDFGSGKLVDLVQNEHGA
jgi:hypothetical protein